MKHLLKLGDLSREEILSILNLADQLKFERNNGIQKEYLKGKKLGMISRRRPPARGFRSRRVCTNLADTRCFCRATICR